MTKKFILINKPVGPTSFGMISKLRRITNIKKIGHAGTLDPFASGLLLIAIGRESTREISKFVGLDKEYIATLKLGAVTSSYDKMEEVKNKKEVNVSKEDIEKVLKKFIGEQDQIPPMFSAKKVQGKKLYELARKGIEIERKSSQITIHNLKLLNYNKENNLVHPVKSSEAGSSKAKFNRVKIKVNCSSGTYIRSLGHDIGQELGCGAYLEELTRTKIGEFDLKDAVEIENLTSENWQEFCIKEKE